MPQPSRWSFEAIGTRWEIETETAVSESTKRIVREKIEVFDRTYSRFRDDSLVTKILRQAGIYTFPDESRALFDLYDTLYEISDGRVTPSIGSLLEDYGYDAGYSLSEKSQKRSVVDWTEVSRNGPVIAVDTPLLIDVGAAGKGLLVDEVADIIRASHTSFVVDASGDLRHEGVLPNRVGLEDPRDTSRIIGSINVQNMSLCASATNRRQWGDGVHHVLDPKTGKPAEEIIATWVLSRQDTMTADGLATALFFCDPAMLRQYFEFEYLRMNAQGAVDYSPAFERQLK